MQKPLEWSIGRRGFNRAGQRGSQWCVSPFRDGPPQHATTAPVGTPRFRYWRISNAKQGDQVDGSWRVSGSRHGPREGELSTNTLVDPPDLAQIRPMRRRAADRVARFPADDQVETGAVGSERVVARRAELVTCLPPAVLAADDARVEVGIELGARPRPSARRLVRHPVAGADAACLGPGRDDRPPRATNDGCMRLARGFHSLTVDQAGRRGNMPIGVNVYTGSPC